MENWFWLLAINALESFSKFGFGKTTPCSAGTIGWKL